MRRRPDCSDAPASDPERRWRRGWVDITSSLVSSWERVVVDPAGARPSPSSRQAQPQQPKGHGYSGNRRQNSSTLPGSCPPVPSLFYTLNLTPHESGLPPDSLGNHHQGFAHITGIFTANQEMAQRWEVTCPRSQSAPRSGTRIPLQVCVNPRQVFSTTPRNSHEGTNVQ